MNRLVLTSIPAMISIMRKNVKCLVILLLVAGFFSSCKDEKMEKQQTICDNSDVETPCNMGDCGDELSCFYLQVWKEMFLEATGFTENYFSEHVFICYGGVSSVSTIPGTNYRKENFNIKYQVQVSWALISHTESFIVKHEDDPYLTKEEIKRERTPYNYHKELSNHEILKFASLESAMTYLKEQTQVDMCVSSVYFAQNTGDFILLARTSSSDFTLSCDNYFFEAYLNLVTGEISTYEGYICID